MGSKPNDRIANSSSVMRRSIIIGDGPKRRLFYTSRLLMSDLLHPGYFPHGLTSLSDPAEHF